MPPRTSRSLAPGTEELLPGKPIDSAQHSVGMTLPATGLGAAINLVREARFARSKDVLVPVLKRIRQATTIRKNLSIAHSLPPAASAHGIPGTRLPDLELPLAGYESIRPLVVPIDLEKRLVQRPALQPSKRYDLPGRPAGADRVMAFSRRAHLQSLSFSDVAPPKRALIDGSVGASSLALHSAPTVVVRDSGDAGDIEHRISSALRRYRSELFDEMKREAARRERLRF